MRIGGEGLLSWNGADPDRTLHSLLAAVARLLQPNVGDSPSFGVGEVCRPCSTAVIVGNSIGKVRRPCLAAVNVATRTLRLLQPAAEV